jgi:hypothetical protein
VAERLSDEQLRAAYEAGASVRVLAARMQRSYGWTHARLAALGTPMRPKGLQRGARLRAEHRYSFPASGESGRR